MKVTCLYRNDPERALTDPVLESTGRAWVHRIYTGSFAEPEQGADWFGPNYPKNPTIKDLTGKRCHFFAWRYPDWVPFIGGKAGYAGYKIYGFDSPAYLNWPGITEADVFEGSQALCFTCRPFATIKE